MEIEIAKDKTASGEDKVPLAEEEKPNEPASNASSEGCKSDETTTNIREEFVAPTPKNVPESADTKDDEFYDAENASIAGSQDHKNKETADDSEVEEVFMDLDDPDESVKTAESEVFDDSVIELDQTDVNEEINEKQTDLNKSVEVEEKVQNKDENKDEMTVDENDEIMADDEISQTNNVDEDAMENIQTDCDAKSDVDEIAITEGPNKPNAEETMEGINDIVISEVFRLTDEKEAEKITTEDEPKNANGVESQSMNINDNSVLEPSKDEEKALLSERESEAKCETEIETVAETTSEQKETDDVPASDKHESENEEDTLTALLSQNDEADMDEEEDKEMVPLAAEDSAMESEDNFSVENMPNNNKDKTVNNSTLNESFDLFASESSDLDNLTNTQKSANLVAQTIASIETGDLIPTVSTNTPKTIEDEGNKNAIEEPVQTVEMSNEKKDSTENGDLEEPNKVKLKDCEQENIISTSSETNVIEDKNVEIETHNNVLIKEMENVSLEQSMTNLRVETEAKIDNNEAEVTSATIEDVQKDACENKETPMEVDDENASVTVPTKEYYVRQQKIDIELPAKKAADQSVIEIDDDDDEDKAKVANKVEEVTNDATKMQLNESQATNGGNEKRVFYNKECINIECKHKQKEYYLATLAVLQLYKVEKKVNKKLFVCDVCYEKAICKYEEYVAVMKNKMPLLGHVDKDLVPDGVEIIESSDEEDNVNEVLTKSVSSDFSTETLKMIERELEDSIRNVFDNVDIHNQMKWCKGLLDRRLMLVGKLNDEHTIELARIQHEVDSMQTAIYQFPKVQIRALQPLDLNSSTDSDICCDTRTATTALQEFLPPIGEIVRPPLAINNKYYAVKNKPIASWVECKLLEFGDNKSFPLYKIKYTHSQHHMVKSVTAKNLAYFKAPEVRLNIGSRVIAFFDVNQLQRGKDKKTDIQSAYYPGIIAEPLRANNKYRYLIFYDDGYTQYVRHEHVRLVCSVADNVWEDVHPNSREFIQKYLMQYAVNRPMVQTQKGQTMQTESDGKWMHARVVDIDCSLVQMQFEGPKTHIEWIYRGSARLGPVFKEFQKNKDSSTVLRLTRRTEPFIRYTLDEEITLQQQREAQQKLKAEQQQKQLRMQQQQQQQLQQQQQQQQQQPQMQRPPTAKKSTSLPYLQQQQQQQQQQHLQKPQQKAQPSSSTIAKPQTVRHLNNSTIYLEDDSVPKGKTIFYQTKRDLPPNKYVKHKCSRACRAKLTHSLATYNPLSKPLISGWERMLMRHKSKNDVVYRGPCGKIMRNMKEMHAYLRATDCIWNVEHFDFSPDINCLAEFVTEVAILKKRDISNGQEKMPIPLVNCYDTTMPPDCEYSAQRIPTDGVNLNLDEEFLVGCDCEDDCSDKSKCSCWQLTLAGAKYGNPNTPINDVGYQYKRLFEHIPTGIYECNSRCKCKSSCLNRVVQQQLQLKLEVFKTSNRGWGLRCLNDVPRGCFVCIYAGHLLTEAKANEGGIDAGDEYFAELDYIEVAEQIKEGYENEAESIEMEEEEEEIYVSEEYDDDDEFRPHKQYIKKNRSKTRSMRQDDESLERQVINFNPNADMNDNSLRGSSMRSLFGKDEACYVMDAKITGNLGRYFNHSCAPNLFVQNVFVDTHDLRFPWVAFFASSNIRSGTELTWNYNYEVGVVPGKVLYCQCGAPTCRQRLL